jgi:hypothetical protein
MGLDWIVGAKPRDAADYEVLRRALAHPGDQRLLEAWHLVPKLDSWDTINAPRVGTSPEADAWLMRQVEGSSADELAAMLERHRGFAVVQLVPCDGVPVYSNAWANRDLEATSFRGAFLADAVPVIGEGMFERAHQNMLPAELLAFGAALEAVGTSYAERHGVSEQAARRRPPDEDEGPASIAHIIASAARWCSFWARHGHWLNTWA